MNVRNQWLDDGRCRVCGDRFEHEHPFAEPDHIPDRMTGLALVAGDSRTVAPMMLKGPHVYRKYWVVRYNTRSPEWRYEWLLQPRSDATV